MPRRLVARAAVLMRRCKLTRLARKGRWKTYAVALALGLGVGNGIGIATQPKAPIQVLEIREVDGVAIAGRRLDLYFRLVKRADCNARVYRWLWSWAMVEGEFVKKKVPIVMEPVNPIIPVGVETSYILSIPVPQDLQPGHYFYESETRDGCGWGSRFLPESVRYSPPIPVYLADPSPMDPPQVIPAPGPVTVVPAK